MIKQDVIEYFDRCAPMWDADMRRDDEIINTILDNAKIKEGSEVLDVACGTGVLFTDYMNRNVAGVLGVDISPTMVEIAQNKISDKRISVMCADIENVDIGRKFDCAMLYNAFPHFPEREKVIKALADNLKPGGILSIAHGMSREMINRHHEGDASKVSCGLISAEELAELFKPYVDVTHIISTTRMYQVCGIKNMN